MSSRRIIDVHAHLTPPAYVQDLAGAGDLQPPTLNWTIEKHIEDMDKAGVEWSILSVTTPGVWFKDVARGRRLARITNDYAAEMAQRHPGRIGQFAAIPLPDTEGSLREIEYGLDVLKADGVALFTNYGDKWLGDPAFAPVMEELNRRKAVVYTHPIAADCCANIQPHLRDAVIEYGTDTTRAIGGWIMTGAGRRWPDIRMIFSHAGGTMPFLIERFDRLANVPSLKQHVPDGFRAEAAKYFYDTAQSANPVSMGALRQVVPVSQVVFGTDFPFRTAIDHVERLEQGKVFSDAELRGIWREHVLPLMPRLA
jgi:predicted TIM-barrel fold metal-dependent hydrolase